MSQNAVMTVWTANRKAFVRVSAMAIPDEAQPWSARMSP